MDTHTLFPVYIAILIWLGLYLRNARSIKNLVSEKVENYIIHQNKLLPAPDGFKMWCDFLILLGYKFALKV